MTVPLNIKIMAGILPIAIGYIFLTESIFWNNRHNYDSFSDTAYTFFCMMNGDSVLSTFIITTEKFKVIGQLMTYSFTFMAICVWQKMNLVIVADSYLNVKYKSGFSWLTGNQSSPDEGGEDRP